jgi:hypothetical protein
VNAGNEQLRMRFTRAAQTHDRASRLHSSAADLFDRQGRHDAAARERAAADSEAVKAAADWQEAERLAGTTDQVRRAT